MHDATLTTLLPPLLLTAATIFFWATARLPEYLVALLFFTAALVLRIAPPGTVFAGFSSSAFWLVLSGFVIGVAIRKVGLADRTARWLAQRLGGSWLRMVGGLVLLTYALAFVMPSNMGRVALLMPIVLALADRAGFEPGSIGRSGLALATGFGTYQLSASILPANVPNLVMAGAAENAFGVHFAYLPYLLLHAPVLGIAKGAVIALCVVLLFPARPRAIAAESTQAPWTNAERRLAVLLALTLALWMTDALHGVSPAWVGLAAACACLLPRIGFLSGDEFAAGVNFRTCIYVAGILGLAAVVAQSGLGTWLGNELLAAMKFDPAEKARGFGLLVALSTMLGFVVTANGVPALFTPLAGTLADAAGLPLATVLMVQVISYATPLLPYQASPIVVAMGMGGVRARDGVRLALLVAAITFFVLAPLDYAWFRLLGLIV